MNLEANFCTPWAGRGEARAAFTRAVFTIFGLWMMGAAVAVDQVDSVAVSGVLASDVAEFESNTKSILGLISTTWHESMKYPSYGRAFLQYSSVFPSQIEFIDFAMTAWDEANAVWQLQWIPLVSNANRKNFESSVGQSISNFSIFVMNGSVKHTLPQNWSQYYFPVLYVAPFRESVAGLDINDNTEGPAFLRAWSTGELATTDPFDARIALNGQNGFNKIMSAQLPLFHSTTDSQPPTFLGCISGLIAFRAFLINALGGLNIQHTDVFMFWFPRPSDGLPVVSHYVGHFESAPESTAPKIDPAAANLLKPEMIDGDIVTVYTSALEVNVSDKSFRFVVRRRLGTTLKDVVITAATDGETTVCKKMAMCTQQQQVSTAVITVSDTSQRAITFLVNGDDQLYNCSPRGAACNITFSRRVKGVYIVSIFADGTQVTDSPVLVDFIPRICQGRRTPDDNGNCLCPLGELDSSGTCIQYSVLLPAVLISSAFGLAILAAMLFQYQLARQRVDWRVDPRDLVFPVEEELLGSGAQGLVVKALFRGTPVAVKRFLLESSGPGSQYREALDSSVGRRMSASDTFLRFASAASSRPSTVGKVSMEEDHDRSGFSYDTRPSIDRSPSEGRSPPAWYGENKESVAYNQLKSDMRKLVSVRHPCISAVMGVAVLQSDGTHMSGSAFWGPSLVMEYSELGSLWDLLHNLTFPMHSDGALRILRDVTQGMRFLHEGHPPILHGRLKSTNVLVDPTFRGRITDYGLGSGACAKPQGRIGPRALALWKAPEVLCGRAPHASADAWSFGVLVCEVLTRSVPYSGVEPYEAAMAVARGELRPAAPPEASMEIATLVSDCARADPASRPPFAELDRRLGAMEPAQLVTKVVGAEPAQRESQSLHHLPAHVVSALVKGEKVPPEPMPMVSMLFSDVAGFTTLSSELSAEKVSGMLGRLFDRLDKEAQRLEIYKLETIGDAYLCATNLIERRDDHAARLARFALAAAHAASTTLVDEDDPGRGTVRLRVGLHSGPCVACVVGELHPKYTLLGDTVNTASRMESTSKPGHVQCSAATAALIREQDAGMRLARRGRIEVKGKGSMETFWVLPEGAEHGPEESAEAPSEAAAAASQASTADMPACGPIEAWPPSAVDERPRPFEPCASASPRRPAPYVSPRCAPALSEAALVWGGPDRDSQDTAAAAAGFPGPEFFLSLPGHS